MVMHTQILISLPLVLKECYTGCISCLTEEHFYAERWYGTFNDIDSLRLITTVEPFMHEAIFQVAYEDQNMG